MFVVLSGVMVNSAKICAAHASRDNVVVWGISDGNKIFPGLSHGKVLLLVQSMDSTERMLSCQLAVPVQFGW